MRSGQVLFTFCTSPRAGSAPTHCSRRATAIAYETVQLPDGSLPLLAPMSEVAGRMAPQVGAATCSGQRGRGMLIGGVPGVYASKVVVLGGGRFRHECSRLRSACRAHVTFLDINISKLGEIDRIYQGRLQTLRRTPTRLSKTSSRPIWSLGQCSSPGRKRPNLVTNDLVARMKPGAVLVDIAIDQGGCFEASRPTTHDDPTYQGARHGLLLRRQHARRGAAHLHVRTHQRHAAVCGAAREQGLEAGAVANAALARPQHHEGRSSTRRSQRRTACRGCPWRNHALTTVSGRCLDW